MYYGLDSSTNLADDECTADARGKWIQNMNQWWRHSEEEPRLAWKRIEGTLMLLKEMGCAEKTIKLFVLEDGALPLLRDALVIGPANIVSWCSFNINFWIHSLVNKLYRRCFSILFNPSFVNKDKLIFVFDLHLFVSPPTTSITVNYHKNLYIIF